MPHNLYFFLLTLITEQKETKSFSVLLLTLNFIAENLTYVSSCSSCSFIILDFLYKLTEPLLYWIRKIIPNFGFIDISPIILILIIEAIQYVITKYGFI